VVSSAMAKPLAAQVSDESVSALAETVRGMRRSSGWTMNRAFRGEIPEGPYVLRW